MVYLASHSHSESGGAKNGGSSSNNGHSSIAHPPPPPSSGNQSDNEVSSSAGDDDEREGRIRVGKDYQAVTPSYIPEELRRPAEQCPERALLVWSPAPQITHQRLDEYIQVAKEKYGYNAEQALGMLFWHKHDLDKAVQDLANFTPFPDEWSVEDKVLFEQAFQFHGKSFHRIRQMLPDKTIEQLVKYYYSWKKTRTRTSLMDRQARKLQAQREEQGLYGEEIQDESEGEAEAGGANSATAGATGTAGGSGSGAGNATGLTASRESPPKPKCFNCGILCHVTHTTPKGQMCGTCHQYYTRTGHVRPTTGPMRKDGTKSKHSLFKNGNRPPKGMHVNHDDLVALATGPSTQGEALLKSMDREIVSYKREVQNNKQYLSALQRRAKEKRVEPYERPPANDPSKINAKWTNEELLLGVQGVRKFGKNFKVIADVIGTKTESHVRSFFVNQRRRCNLDVVLKEYEAEHGPSTPNDENVEMKENGSGANVMSTESNGKSSK